MEGRGRKDGAEPVSKNPRRAASPTGELVARTMIIKMQ